MTQQNTSVNLLRVWNVFKKMWLLVLVLALACGIGFYIYTKTTSVGVYRAEAIMYATKIDDNQYSSQYGQQASNSISASDLSLRTLLLNDCIYLANSPLVIDDVNKDLERYGFGKISSGQVSAQIVESTRYFKVSVITTNPEMSNKALTALCASIQTQVKRIIQVDNIEKISQTQAVGPIVASASASGAKGLALGAIIGMLIVVLIAFSDRTIKNDDEFIALFPDIPVIGTIPEFNLQTERSNMRKGEKRDARMQQSISAQMSQSTHNDSSTSLRFDDEYEN